MPLTNISVQNAKPKETVYKLSDAGGMFLQIYPNGSRYWRLKYRVHGKEKLLALGVYPTVSLAEARAKRDAARKLIADGLDPSAAKQETKRQAALQSVNTFEALAREWHENRKHTWTERHANYILKRLEADIFPALGQRPVAEILAPELLRVLRQVESRGALEIASRLLQSCSAIFRYGITIGRADRNPAADLKGALKPPQQKHHTALAAKDLPEFLQKLEAYEGHLQTRLALKLLVLTFVRTGELRGMEWAEIDWEAAEWRIPAERMKMREEHIVSLTPTALDILRQMQPLTGTRRFVFPAQTNANKPMSENTSST